MPTSGSLPSVVIVDDVADLRSVVRTRLRLSGRFEVVAEGSDGGEAVALAAEHQPDVVLLDVSMSGEDGLQALPRVRAASPGSRVVMFSGFDERGLAERARALGAAAYLEKSGTLDTLVDDLLAVLAEREPAVSGGAVGDAGDRTGVEEPVLVEHQERFREVFEDAAIGMATLTLTGRLVRANPRLATMLGRPVTDLVGTAYASLASGPADGAALGQMVQAVVSRRRDVARAEHGVRDRAGVRLLATLSPVLSSDGSPLYLFLQVQDVTGQRDAEVALRHSEQRFRLMVENVQDYAIFMLDPQGRIASWNSGAQRHKGWTAEEAIGQHFRLFYPPEEQQRRHPEHELEIALAEGRYEEEGWRVRKDGSRFWAQVTITAVRDEDGTLLGFGKVTRDVTERRRLQVQQEESALALAQANEMLQRAADDQAQFLAVTAHELRGPVGTLGMAAQTMRRHWADLTDEERDDLLAGMASGTERLNRLLTDLLTASRIQASALELTLSSVRLREHLARMITTLRATRPEAVVELDVAGEPVVRADAGRLSQAVENLVGNALRHGRAPVRVVVRETGEQVEIAVTDAGDGVSPEMVPRLFDRFATGRRGGTGLGLHIVRELARAQGGDATYRVADGAFVLTLPRGDDGARP